MNEADQNVPTVLPADETLVPQRFWWLRRLALAGAVLVVVLGVAHAAAVWATRRNLDSLIKSYRDAGQPVLPEDFNPREALPAQRDAAALYIRAAGLIAVPSSFPADVSLDSFRDLAFVRDNLDLAEDLVNTNGEVLALLHKARGLREADWGIRAASPMISVTLPGFQPQRALSRMASTAIIVRRAEGDDARAVETVRDAMHHADLLESEPTLVISHLVALSCRDLVVKALEIVTPELRVDRVDTPPVLGGAASREQVVSLVAELLASELMQESLRAGIIMERASMLDAVNCVCDGSLSLNAITGMVGGGPTLPVGGPVTRAVMKPIWLMDAAESLRYFTSIVDAHQHDNYVQVTANLPADPELINHDVLLMRPSLWLMPSLTRQTQIHYRNLAMRRMAAVALALRLYELDHGSRPASLDELVPDYLAAVPLDPFDGQGGPIRYLPRADPPLLYSLGLDGVDSNGEFTMRRRSVDPDALDLVYFLDGNRPVVSRASPQPATPAAQQSEAAAQGEQPADAMTQPADAASQPAEREQPGPL